MIDRFIHNAWHGTSLADVFERGGIAWEEPFVSDLEAAEDADGVFLGIMASKEAGDAVIALQVQFDDEYRVAVQFTPDQALLFARELVRLEVLARVALAEDAGLGGAA